jgi:hypothetical protein
MIGIRANGAFRAGSYTDIQDHQYVPDKESQVAH